MVQLRTRFSGTEGATRPITKFDAESGAGSRFETNEAHGMRAWRAGQKLEVRVDWDAVKVEKMLAVNRAKYAQNPDLAADLLATGTDTITGKPGDACWEYWNGRIQMLIREELRDNPDMTASNSINSALIPVDRPLLEILRAEFLAYAAPVTALSRIMAELAGMQSVSTGASANEQQSERACPACTFVNPAGAFDFCVMCLGPLHFTSLKSSVTAAAPAAAS